ncbi:hypothetical protein V1517DRAFT_316347 [Lipomyces orientalis]|uniref:Uncharacterized protein n=1 Tax=Lipomyces orientalis TaxID=1233043 RepID=A0ACC3TXB6_9ASCO
MVDSASVSDMSGVASAPDQSQSTTSSASQPSPSNLTYMKVPTLIKTVFDKFPLVKYPEAALPSTCLFPAPAEKIGTAFVHSTADDSIYPQSIRLLTILKLAGVIDKLAVIPSSPHAAPKSGSVPYVFLRSRPRIKSDLLPRTLYPESKAFHQWLASIAPSFPAFDTAKQNPLLSLVDIRLRDAWLLTLYLYPANYKSILVPRLTQAYSHSDTSTSIIPHILAYSASREAQQLLTRSTGVSRITETIQRSIITNAEEALDALAILLSDSGAPYINGGEPGVLDAAVYGYLRPILGLELKSLTGDGQAELKTLVQERKALVDLVERIHDQVRKV